MSKISILIRKKAGVTLTEVLFSAAIIALVVVSVLFVFVQTVDMSKRVDYEYAGTNIAKNRIERVRALMESSGFDSLTDLDETDSPVNSDGVADPEGEFKRSTQVTANHLGNERLTEVDVQVVYRYRGEWKTQIPITMTAVFTNIE